MEPKQKSQVMEKGLWKMAKPMMLEHALLFFLPLADTFFLSRISDEAAAAVGSVTAFLFLSNTILWVTAFAGSSVASQRIGANDYDKANATIFVYGSWLLLGSVFAISLVYFGGPVVTTLMGLPTEIKVPADTYLAIGSVMVGIWGIRGFLQSIVTLYGMPQWNFFANFVGFIVNVFGNAAVVNGWFGIPQWGIVGIAWASVLASAVVTIILAFVVFVRIRLRFNMQTVKQGYFRYSRQIGRIVAPSLIDPLSFDVNMVVLSAIVAKLGTLALIARTYTFNTFLTLLIVTVAFGTANEVIVAQWVGAKNYLKANQQLHRAVKIVVLATFGVGLIYFLLAPQIMGFYTNEEYILSMAFVYFFLALMSEPGRSLNIVVGNALRATGDGWYISIVGLGITWLIAIPLAYIFAITVEMGLIGILLSAIIDESSRGILNYWRWRKNRWQKTNVIAHEESQQGLESTN